MDVKVRIKIKKIIKKLIDIIVNPWYTKNVPRGRHNKINITK